MASMEQRKKEMPRNNPENICRSEAEAGLMFLMHFLVMVFYAGVHVYGTYLYYSCEDPDKYFVGWNRFGGQLRYLTMVVLWLCLLYYIMSVLCDLFQSSPKKTTLRQATDLFFTSVVFPFSLLICVAFWIIYFIDREGIFPSYFDEYIPAFINHCWHTLPMLISILESILVYHEYPSNSKATFIVLVFTVSYLIWITYLFTITGKWVYPFLNVLSVSQFVIFVGVCYVLLFVFYFSGKTLSFLVWKERYKALKGLKQL